MHWFREARPEIITQCSRIRVANKLETESFLCVKCCFIFRLRRKKNNKWQQKHGRLQAQFQFYAALFATRWIFMPRIPPSREKPNIFAVFFISLGSWGNYVDKNLSLPRRTTVYLIFFKKKTMISAIRGAQAPDSSVLPCSLSCSVLIFFLGLFMGLCV